MVSANGTANVASSNGMSKGASAYHEPYTASSKRVWLLLPYVGATVAIMHLLYLMLYYIYENGYTAAIGLPLLDPEDCDKDESNDKCGRADQFAFQIVSGFTFLVIGNWALYDWHLRSAGSLKQSIPNTAMGRLYAHNEVAQWITVINLGYQIWDFAVSLTIPEYCTVVMMSHHTAAAIVAWSGIYNDMLSYYALFFMGITEFSSIWLVSLDIAKYFALTPGSLLQLFFQYASGPLFMLSFIYYRILLWWPCSLQLLNDVREVTSTGKAAEARGPGRTWILYLWLGLNFPLGLLQIYWLTLILTEAKNVVMLAF